MLDLLEQFAISSRLVPTNILINGCVSNSDSAALSRPTDLNEVATTSFQTCIGK